VCGKDNVSLCAWPRRRLATTEGGEGSGFAGYRNAGILAADPEYIEAYFHGITKYREE
jgi:hypothetical protein